MPTAFVQVPAFQEGAGMLPVLDGIAAQQPPDGWRVEREVWVTLSPPDRELCTTWQAALEATGFDVREAPRGKLSARNAAHDRAVASGADVVVSWDADCRPAQDGVLTALLEAVAEPGVAAADGRPRAPWTTPLNAVSNVVAGAEDVVRPHLHGQVAAVTAEGWRAAGPLDESVDQTSMREVRREEEFGFRRRLQAVGRVVRPRGAVVVEDPRRREYRVNRAFDRFPGGGYPLSEWGGNRGVTSFGPDRKRKP